MIVGIGEGHEESRIMNDGPAPTDRATLKPDPPVRSLPHGPHGLSREEVEQSQRDRILWAMAEASAERGYANTSVADVLSMAGVSRATFYLMFRDKEDCFGSAYEMLALLIASTLSDELAKTMAEEQASGRPHQPIETLDKLLAILFKLLADAPSLARIYFVEVHSAGPLAAEYYKISMERFVDLVAEIFRGERGLLGSEPEQRFSVELLVGGVTSLITSRVAVGDFQGVLDLREPIVRMARSLPTSPRHSKK
jgi:AcrR family transcriptional regulator